MEIVGNGIDPKFQIPPPPLNSLRSSQFPRCAYTFKISRYAPGAPSKVLGSDTFVSPPLSLAIKFRVKNAIINKQTSTIESTLFQLFLCEDSSKTIRLQNNSLATRRRISSKTLIDLCCRVANYTLSQLRNSTGISV